MSSRNYPSGHHNREERQRKDELTQSQAGALEVVDKSVQVQIKHEKEYWRQLLLRILSLVKILTGHYITFEGANRKIYEEKNGIFLQFIETIAEFDPIMQEHLRHIQRSEIYPHYLGHKIQNELISLMAKEVKNKIIEIIKKAKYFSVILDCSTDISGEEQMSLVIRCVDNSTSPVHIKEFFLEFLEVSDTAGQGLSNVLIEVLETLQLDIDDIRGQGYDDDSTMKGKNNGVKEKILEMNPRAFYTPCGCHSLNIAFCDIANSCSKASYFFGAVRSIYALFSSSTNLWKVLTDNVEGLTLKPLSHAYWESDVESVKAIRYQAPQIRDALFHLANTSVVPIVKSTAESLITYELENFEFLLAMIIWHNLLFAVNSVSKTLEAEDMDLDIVLQQLRGLISFLKKYRENGFVEAITEAKEVANAMEIEPVFRERRAIRRKKQLDGSVSEEVTQSAEQSFINKYFLYVVDQGIYLLEYRMEQFQLYEGVFGFLFDLKKLSSIQDECLQTSCNKLEEFLKCGEHRDIDGRDLFVELKILKEVLPKELKRPIEVLNHLILMDCYLPNAWIAYRILLTIPITVASSARSFSKLKLIKSYLGSEMPPERLNGLDMLSIENDLANKLEYATLISDFASANARRVIFQ